LRYFLSFGGKGSNLILKKVLKDGVPCDVRKLIDDKEQLINWYITKHIASIAKERSFAAIKEK